MSNSTRAAVRYLPQITISRLLGALALLLVLLLGGCGGSGTPQNVLLIIVDTTRADRIGCYGFAPARTPHMDKLAEEGHRFHNTISQVPVTTPSISTILTGTYPQFHGIRDNGKWSLDPSMTTLAEIFAENGYQTGAFVSAAVLEKKYGLDQGYDVYDDDVSMPWKFFHQRHQVKTEDHQNIERRADETTNRAIPWLRQHSDQPFFLTVHYFDPHDPYDAPPSHQSVPGATNYDAEIYYADDNIGRLLQALEWEDVLKETLVIVTADHGEGLKEHNEMSHGFFIYDSTIRVPLIFQGPGVKGEGVVTDQVVRLVDIAPTILDMCGLLPEDFGQGRSLAPLVRGEVDELPPEPAYMETYRTVYSYNWSELVGLRTEQWKYIRAPKSELYDLVTDPGELTNLFDVKQDKVTELSRRLDHLLSRTEAEKQIAGELPPDKETQRKMKALGYISTTADEEENEEPDKPRMDPKDGTRLFADRQVAKDKIWQGKALLEQGKKDEAWQKIREALELAPHLATANYNMGLFYQFDREYDKAREYFSKAVEYDPAFTRGWMSLGVLAYADGQDSKCREYFENAYHSDPQWKTAFSLLFAFIRTEAFDEAIAFLDQLAERYPGDPGPVKAKGFVYYARGDLEKEYDYWVENSLSNPADATAQYRLHRLELWKASPNIYELMREGRYKEAIPVLEKAYKASPDNHRLGDALVWALAASKSDLERANQINTALISADPKHRGIYLVNDGLIKYFSGQYQQAQGSLNNAAQTLQSVYEPYLSTVRFYQGAVAEALGNKDMAKRLYSTALASSLGSPWEPEAWQGGGVRLLMRHQEAQRVREKQARS